MPRPVERTPRAAHGGSRSSYSAFYGDQALSGPGRASPAARRSARPRSGRRPETPTGHTSALRTDPARRPGPLPIRDRPPGLAEWVVGGRHGSRAGASAELGSSFARFDVSNRRGASDASSHAPARARPRRSRVGGVGEESARTRAGASVEPVRFATPRSAWRRPPRPRRGVPPKQPAIRVSPRASRPERGPVVAGSADRARLTRGSAPVRLRNAVAQLAQSSWRGRHFVTHVAPIGGGCAGTAQLQSGSWMRG